MVEEAQIEMSKAGGGAKGERMLSLASRARLTRLLIAKSIAETIFVAALALLFYFTAFPPYYRGWGEATAQKSIAGWAVNVAAPWDRVEVYLFIDDRFVSSATANLSRPDVSGAGYTKDEWHGYVFNLPPLEKGEHLAHVYAIHRSAEGKRQTLQLLGNPIRFRVEENSAEASPGVNTER
jgi:hypothetical protein